MGHKLSNGGFRHKSPAFSAVVGRYDGIAVAQAEEVMAILHILYGGKAGYQLYRQIGYFYGTSHPADFMREYNKPVILPAGQHKAGGRKGLRLVVVHACKP